MIIINVRSIWSVIACCALILFQHYAVATQAGRDSVAGSSSVIPSQRGHLNDDQLTNPSSIASMPRSQSRYLFRLRWKGAGGFDSTSKASMQSTESSSSDVRISRLKTSDPELAALISRESTRQLSGINMIASENYASVAVLEALGSPLTNKYSEGMPGRRYYSGTDNIDAIERLCQDRALAAFGLDSLRGSWAVNVQPYSGSIANFAVYTALLRNTAASSRGPIMALELSSGGHLSHGHRTTSKNISATSMYFDTVFYRVDPQSGLIDYDAAERLAIATKPRVIVAGASSYPRFIDYERMRKIADSVGAYLVADIAHVAGLYVGEVAQRNQASVEERSKSMSPSMLEERYDPFLHSHIVTTTTQKTLRGPRAAMIFYDRTYISPASINSAVFPGLQGGPNNAAIAALAVALKEAVSPDFAMYIMRVRRTAAILAEQLATRSHFIVSNGTDNHIVLLHLESYPSYNCKCHLTGDKVEKLLELCGIFANKNVVPIVVNQTMTVLESAAFPLTSIQAIPAESCVKPVATAVAPRGLRLGTAALSTRFPNLSDDDVRSLADIIHDVIAFAQEACSSASGNTMSAFLETLERPLMVVSLHRLKKRASDFVERFPVPEEIDYKTF